MAWDNQQSPPRREMITHMAQVEPVSAGQKIPVRKTCQLLVVELAVRNRGPEKHNHDEAQVCGQVARVEGRCLENIC